MASSVMTKADIKFRDFGSPNLICFGDSNVVSFSTMSAEAELT